MTRYLRFRFKELTGLLLYRQREKFVIIHNKNKERDCSEKWLPHKKGKKGTDFFKEQSFLDMGTAFSSSGLCIRLFLESGEEYIPKWSL
jgi:hypothetical protein